MPLCLSDPPVSRRSQTFARRWARGPFGDLVRSCTLREGGPLALVDNTGHVLTYLRGDSTSYFEGGGIPVGEGGVAKLIGDTSCLDPRDVSRIDMIVSGVNELCQELDELSSHALERYREISLLYDFTERSGTSTNIADISDFALRKSTSVAHAHGASLMMKRDNGMFLIGSVGTVPGIAPDVAERVLTSGRPLVGMFPDSLREPERSDWEESLVCLPVPLAGRNAGVLTVMAKPGRQLRSQDLRLLSALSNLLAVRVEQGQLLESSARRRELAAIGQVASAIVHDFKNPLTAIRGFAEMIELGALPPEDVADFSKQIIENVDRLWSMVDEILHFVRGNRAALELTSTTGLELEKILRISLSHGLPSCISLEVTLAALGEVTLDVRKFERVIVNLVRNASEAIRRRGHVRVMVENMESSLDHYDIVVEDDGPGIPRQLRENLFDPFVSLGKVNGTGLGLAIVKKIVEEHGGTVRYESGSISGSRFILRLPRNGQRETVDQ